MSKLERTVSARYKFDEVLKYLHDGILSGGKGASFEDGSDWQMGAVRCVLRVYERYSLMGDSRLSLTLMMAGDGESIRISAVTAAGGRGMGKLLAWGEDGFLKDFQALAEALDTE